MRPQNPKMREVVQRKAGEWPRSMLGAERGVRDEA
jgi:hypothetical protein